MIGEAEALGAAAGRTQMAADAACKEKVRADADRAAVAPKKADANRIADYTEEARVEIDGDRAATAAAKEATDYELVALREGGSGSRPHRSSETGIEVSALLGRLSIFIEVIQGSAADSLSSSRRYPAYRFVS